MLKVRNKYNYPILTILLLWICFAIYLWFEVNPDNCGSMIVYMGFLFITILAFPICTIIIAVTNKICKKKYNTDFELVAIPYILLLFLFGIYILYLTT